jgi:hypothetical protein
MQACWSAKYFAYIPMGNPQVRCISDTDDSNARARAFSFERMKPPTSAAGGPGSREKTIMMNTDIGQLVISDAFNRRWPSAQRR